MATCRARQHGRVSLDGHGRCCSLSCQASSMPPVHLGSVRAEAYVTHIPLPIDTLCVCPCAGDWHNGFMHGTGTFEAPDGSKYQVRLCCTSHTQADGSPGTLQQGKDRLCRQGRLR